MIRDGRDADGPGIIALIGGCWAEYPGVVFDVDGELPELRALASYFAAQGGRLWVAEQDGAIAGMIATRPLGADDAWEICRLYVAAAQRGTGLAPRLLAVAEGLTQRLLDAPDQAREAAALPPVLRAIATELGELSDQVTRRYFALLPPARAVGVDVGMDALVIGA